MRARLVVILLFIGFFNSYAAYDVKWRSVIGMNYNPSTNTLTKNLRNSWWDGAISYNKLASNEDGSISFEIIPWTTHPHKMIGLSTYNTAGAYSSIKYAIYFYGGGVQIRESGSYKASGGTSQIGDIYTVERHGTNVFYKRTRSGVTTTIYTSASTVNPTDELYADCSIYFNGAVLSNVTATFGVQMDVTATPSHIDLENNVVGAIDIDVQGPSGPYTYLWSNGSTTQDLNNIPKGTYDVEVKDIFNNTKTYKTTIDYMVKWRDLVGTNYTPSSNTISNNTYNSWCNSRGLSKNKLPAGINGHIQYEISNTNMQMFLGFTTTSNSSCFHAIKHSIHQQRANFKIYENGYQKLSSYGALQVGDIISIAIDRNNGLVRYKITRDGVETLSKTRTLNIASNEDAYVDFRLYYVNSSMSNVSCSFTSSNSIKYAELYPKLDGSFYKVENDKLRFHYVEEYEDLDGFLNYAIYPTGSNSTINLPSKQVKFGSNYYEIDLSSIQIPGYYILEVTGQKKEQQFLRFYYKGNPIVDPVHPCVGCSAQ